MSNIKINDRVCFKHSIAKEIGTVIGVIKKDILDKKGNILVYKGDFKVKLDSQKKGHFVPASDKELELVEE